MLGIIPHIPFAVEFNESGRAYARFSACQPARPPGTLHPSDYRHPARRLINRLQHLRRRLCIFCTQQEEQPVATSLGHP